MRINLRTIRYLLYAYCLFDWFIGGNAGGFLPLTPLAAAQFTQVTGTVTDPNGVPYSGGTIAPTLVTSASPTFTATHLPYTPPTQPTGLSNAGTFTMQLADNTQLTPGGTTWNFSVCSGAGTILPAGGNGPVCFILAGVTITGASQDISTLLQALAPALGRGSSIAPGTVTCPQTDGTTIACIGGPAAFTAPVSSTGAITGGLGSATTGAVGVDTAQNALTCDAPNDSGTGTAPNLLARINTSGNAVTITTAASQIGIVGPVVGGAGTTGTARMACGGTSACTFDGATTFGDWAIPSVTVAGNCHDTGLSTWPVNGQAVGLVIQSIGSAGLAKMLSIGIGAIGSSSSVLNDRTGSYTMNSPNTSGALDKIHNAADGQTVTTPATHPPNGWYVTFVNTGLGVWNILVNGSDGTATLNGDAQIAPGQSQSLFSDGTNYFVVNSDQIVTCKATAALTAGQFVKWDAANDRSCIVVSTTPATSDPIIGAVQNSPGAGANAFVATGGVIANPIVGTGTCSRGNLVHPDTTTAGRVKCDTTYVAGTQIGFVSAGSAIAVGAAVTIQITKF